eukprot:jgi/Chrzof1/3918/Cz13g13110.t1
MALRRGLQALLPRVLGSPAELLAPASALANSSVVTSAKPQTSQPFEWSLLRSYASEVATLKPESLPPTDRISLSPTHHIVYDEAVHKRLPPGVTNHSTAVLIQAGGRFFYATAARLMLLKFVLSMSAAADVLAMASLEVDLSGVEEGQTVTVKWRGKPVFIRHRTDEEISEANQTPLSELRDPQPDAERVVDPKYLVVVGVCTHLGCVPIAGAGDYNGWFCPCHGSHYDVSGRIRKGPAPYNLEVPEYRFLGDGKAVIG